MKMTRIYNLNMAAFISYMMIYEPEVRECEDIDDEKHGNYYFLLPDEQEVWNLIGQYHDGNGMVEARDFIRCFNTLKYKMNDLKYAKKRRERGEE